MYVVLMVSIYYCFVCIMIVSLIRVVRVKKISLMMSIVCGCIWLEVVSWVGLMWWVFVFCMLLL